MSNHDYTTTLNKIETIYFVSLTLYPMKMEIN